MSTSIFNSICNTEKMFYETRFKKKNCKAFFSPHDWVDSN